MRVEHQSIEHSLNIDATAEIVWREITQVDLASFRHPWYLSALGIPKPLRAEVLRPGVGGARTAYFENDHRFTQKITDWQPTEHYAFTFKPDPGFRVGWGLDLSNGPFRLVSGAYRLSPIEHGTHLSLTCGYELHGAMGVCLRTPVWLVLRLFLDRLLQSIRVNAERRSPGQA